MAGKTRVAKYQADRTNQKLYFCRLACQAAANTRAINNYTKRTVKPLFFIYTAPILLLYKSLEIFMV